MQRVLESGWLAQGPRVVQFEKGIRKYVSGKNALATSSCTTALSLALDACEVPPGSEVIVPDFTFPATGNVVYLHRSVPVIVDVELGTMAMSIDEFERAVTKRTKAVIVVHPFGHPARMDEIRDVAHDKGIEVIEDAATAFGTEYKGRRIGAVGHAVCFSFHPRKLLTTGEGGALVTDSDRVASEAARLRNHGEIDGVSGKEFISSGYNYRMSDVQAAIGLAQLGKFSSVVRERRQQAKLYSELIEDAGIDVVPPKEEAWALSTFQSYVVRLGRGFGVPRDRCIDLMRRRYAIETQIGTYSLHLQQSFSSAPRVGKLARGEELFLTTLTLPLFRGLSEEDQTRVIDSLAAISK